MHDLVSETAFVRLADVPAIVLIADHGGLGPIAFRRLLTDCAFASAIDFVDLSVIPPGSAIGAHEHLDTEELYFIMAGTPLVTVNGDCRRLSRGDLSVVRSGQRHELVNDTAEPVEIFVVQVRV
jgi:glyoxylate utilization-related uncharacterized protein